MPIRPLTSELQKIAEKELNEVPSRIQEDLNHIREWLSKQPHLRARTDDQWLIAFLRASKYSLEQTKKKIDIFYTMKTVLPEFLSHRDPLLPDIQNVLNRGVFIVLPNTAYPGGPRIMLVQAQETDPSEVSIFVLVKVLSMILEIMFMEDDNYNVAGVCGIGDTSKLSYKYMAYTTPDLIRKAAVCCQEAYASRIKGVYGINTPAFVMALYHAFKMVVKEKNRNRIHFYNQENLKDLYKAIPLSVLPKEFGGETGSCDDIAASWKKKVESYRDWFLEDDRYGTDETKRPGQPYTWANEFGTEGSFRKMDVD